MRPSMKIALDEAKKSSSVFEDHCPNPENIYEGAALASISRAVQLKADAERHLISAVVDARAEGHSWAAIGALLGVTGEAARLRYREEDVAPVVRSLPLKQMIEAGWIDEPADPVALAAGVRAMTGNSNEAAKWTPAQMAWLLRARELASRQHVEPYQADQMQRFAESMVFLSASDRELAEIPALLADVGLRLVLLPPLAGSKVDGAAFWLDADSPVVALSLRHDRIDYFLFTLARELAYIVRGHARPGRPIVDGDGCLLEELEHEANELAALWLMPPSAGELPTELSEIVRLANELGISPGIIVGRLHDLNELPFSKHRRTLTGVRDLFRIEAP